MYVLLVLNTQLKVLNVCNEVPNAIIEYAAMYLSNQKCDIPRSIDFVVFCN